MRRMDARTPKSDNLTFTMGFPRPPRGQGHPNYCLIKIRVRGDPEISRKKLQWAREERVRKHREGREFNIERDTRLPKDEDTLITAQWV